MNFERLNPIGSQNLRLRAGAEHERHVGTVHVGIEQTDLVSKLYQGQGQVDGERGLAHPAFAGADRNNGFDPGKRLRLGRLWLGGVGRHMSAHEITLGDRTRGIIQTSHASVRRAEAASSPNRRALRPRRFWFSFRTQIGKRSGAESRNINRLPGYRALWAAYSLAPRKCSDT